VRGCRRRDIRHRPGGCRTARVARPGRRHHDRDTGRAEETAASLGEQAHGIAVDLTEPQGLAEQLASVATSSIWCSPRSSAT